MESKQIRNLRWIDRAASWCISLGGLSVLVSLLLLIVFMVWVTLPLFSAPKVTAQQPLRTDFQTETIMTFAMGPFLEEAMAITTSGRLVFFSLATGQTIASEALALRRRSSADASVKLVAAERVDHQTYSLLWSDGLLMSLGVSWRLAFDEQGKRQLLHHLVVHGQAMTQGAADFRLAIFRSGDSGDVASWLYQSGPRTLQYHRRQVVETLFGDSVTKEQSADLAANPQGHIVDALLDKQGQRVFAVTDKGELLAWLLNENGEPLLLDRTTLDAAGSSATRMAFLLGEVSVVVGNSNGGLQIWHMIPGPNPRLGKLREMSSHETGVVGIDPSVRDKGLVTVDQSGQAFVRYMTSNRLLARVGTDRPLRQMVLAQRGDALLGLRDDGSFQLWRTRIRHPDVSMKTLWGKVWYEGYQEPAYVWQSSSGADDFEPKLSLVPLLFGSLKGTFYGMLFSLPLALMAAIYVSFLMHARWRSLVKPLIELMAAVPTVVVGFLGALWLAPRLENHLLGVVMAIVTLPGTVLLGTVGLARWRRRLSGYEFLWAGPMVLLATWLAYLIGVWIQTRYFDGNFNLWLFQHADTTVDQRNGLVVGIALGFAVIPIIFSISEDALHNVPNSLTAAAMALGSSRWQTLRRVVLPLAAPGIFAAIMIGFGRAVGETMIVLMVTGNTPIIDPSILNGMRTLSANMAIEVPEAPVGGTLYRVLFLSAVLLFAVTFVVNTMAELVRGYMKRRFQQL